MHQPGNEAAACASGESASGGARSKNVSYQRKSNLKVKKFAPIALGPNATAEPLHPEDECLVSLFDH